MSELKNICKKCPHYNYCRNMCPFAKYYSYKGMNRPFERFVDDLENGLYVKRHEMIPARSNREQYLSSLEHENETGEIISEHDDHRMDTLAYKEFWNNIDYRNKRLEIISDVLFKRFTFEDIAKKYGHKDAYTSRTMFRRYIRNFARRVNLLEQERLKLDHIESVKKKMHEKHGNLTKGLKYFLCFHCLDMSTSDISKLFGSARTTVHSVLDKYTKYAQNGGLKLVWKNGEIVEENRRKQPHIKNRVST